MDTTQQAVKIPTPGRIVNYFHNKHDEGAAYNGAESYPAIVLQSWTGSTNVNMQVFTMNSDALQVLAWSVPHKSDGNEDLPYWDWPEIK
jgi:hypothetical protein